MSPRPIDGFGILTVTLGRDDWGSTISLAGELDLAGVDLVGAAVQQVVAAGPLAVTLDCTGLSFADVVGARALIAAHQDLMAAIGLVGLTGVNGRVAHVLELIGLSPHRLTLDQAS